ncbi:MAG TPA: alpha/beta hydrolase [Solirubrobacteraceae bacterium]|nr:alpha/beta hydrolase [Solirubrobacteraceae bacterium]
MRLPEQVRVEGVEHTSVALDGFDAHLATAGDSGGEPVVLLHGWPLHWWSFRHLIRRLAEDGRRVLAPDLRGFGWSGTPGWGYASAQFTRDLFALLEALGVERVDLVGHDWGCFVGYRATLEAPGRFRRFVAMSGPGPHAGYSARTVATLWRYWYQQPLALPILGPRTVRRMGSPRSLVGRWAGLHRTSEEVVRAYMLQFDDRARVDASVALYRDALLHAFTTPFLPEYRHARLRVPTLHIHGTKDRPTSPAFVRPMAARSDQWRLELLDGVGHLILDEAPEQVERLVRPFLTS